MATIDVKDAAGSTVAIEKPITPGRAAASASRPVALATEDKAVLDLLATSANQSAQTTLIGSVTETAPASDTASSGMNGRLQRIAQRIASLIALIPTALGAGGGLKVDGSGTALPVSASAGELHLGEVGGNTALIAVTFTLDTSAYASGDVLAIPTVLTAALRKTDGTGILQSITLNDEDDQGVALYVVIMDANNLLGTINSSSSISDANARNIIGIVPVETTDWIDLGGVRVATIRNLGIPVKSVSGAATLYVGLITRGTPTHTASGITGRFGILRD